MFDDLLSSLQSVYRGHLIAELQLMQPYLQDWRQRKEGAALCVALPSDVDEVACVVRWCAAHDVAVVPQGGNTGLAGGSVPEPLAQATRPAVVLSLKKMNRIRTIDPVNNTMTVEAGCLLQTVQTAAAQAARLFPLSLASEGSCTLGGNLATNAGGVNVLRYGNARELCLGLEVVTANGEVWDGLRALRKDNTGYDLRDLFIGSEGTLGVITAAVLKLFPLPVAKAAAWVALPTPAAALSLLNLAQAKLGASLTAFELISDLAHQLVLKHFESARRPLAQPAPWYVLIEVVDFKNHLDCAALQALLEAALQAQFITDAAVSSTQAQFEALWFLREQISQAQAREGKNIKHDISVPVSEIANFIAQTHALLEAAYPSIRLVTFGHVGDGNLHYNVAPPASASATSDAQRHSQHEAFFQRHQLAIHRIVHDNVAKFNGSISAEHGLGTFRRDEAARFKSSTELALMRAIKQALDPQGIMNPQKVLAAS